MAARDWNRITRIVVLVILAIAGAWFLWVIRPMFRPLVIAGFLAYLLNPLVDIVVEKGRIRRGPAASIVFFGAVGLIIGIALAIIARPGFNEVVAGLVGSMGELDTIDRQVEAALGIDLQLEALSAQLQERVERWLNVNNLLLTAQSLTANAAWTLVSLVATFYFLKDWARLRTWGIGLAPSNAQPDLNRLYAQIRQVWQRFLRGQLLLMLFVGLLSGIGAFAVGLPGALVLGLIAGVLDIIPTLGPWVAMVIAAAVAWVAGSNFLPVSNAAFAVIILGIFFAVQLVENLWLRPRILGYSVRMHPGVVFVAFFTALTLSGVLLAIMIVPLLATAIVIGRYLRCRILGIDPWREGALPHPVGPLPGIPTAQAVVATEPPATAVTGEGASTGGSAVDPTTDLKAGEKNVAKNDGKAEGRDDRDGRDGRDGRTEGLAASGS